MGKNRIGVYFMPQRKSSSGGRYHPSRISGHQKFLRAKKANEIINETKNKKNHPIILLELNNQNWSSQKTKK